MTAAPRIIIVGAGLMGRWHAHAAARAGARVVAVVDVDQTRAAVLAKSSGALTLPHDAWIPSAAADVAHICTPPGSHGNLAAAALRAGMHVVVEKPLAETVAETRSLLELARESRRRIIPVHQFPFQTGMHKLIDARPQLGELVRIAFTTFTAGGAGRCAAGRRSVVLEILPHPISLFHALGYRDLAVRDWLFPVVNDDEIATTINREGVELSIRISLRARPTRNELEVAGNGGVATADLYHGFARVDCAGTTQRDKIVAPFRRGIGMASAAAANLAGRLIRNERAYPGLRALLASFYRSLDGGSSPVTEAEILDAAAFRDIVSTAYAVPGGENSNSLLTKGSGFFKKI